MKKILFALALVGGSLTARSQSINLMNLTNLVGLNNGQVASDLDSRRVFKLQSHEVIDGFDVSTFQTTAPANKIEKIVAGKNAKVVNGGMLYTISYISANPQDVINLMGQIKSINAKQIFTGHDQYDNIYIFDSSIYRMVVRMNFTGTRSSLDISQKYVFAE